MLNMISDKKNNQFYKSESQLIYRSSIKLIFVRV